MAKKMIKITTLTLGETSVEIPGRPKRGVHLMIEGVRCRVGTTARQPCPGEERYVGEAKTLPERDLVKIRETTETVSRICREWLRRNPVWVQGDNPQNIGQLKCLGVGPIHVDQAMQGGSFHSPSSGAGAKSTYAACRKDCPELPKWDPRLFDWGTTTWDVFGVVQQRSNGQGLVLVEDLAEAAE